ncbi:nudix hydrolase 15 [Populus alba x Populus x berolinensis]|uniref:Nudix hydrolase 15 n=1 Tax=Populus alba x Populus x berolinensis TaxID=444605 RepID=A0AAD6LM80_9ROSI|nr:nudix hydrolase 15 [Populus alba x Populus x berolinensis]
MEDAGFKKGMFCGSQTLQKIAEQLQFLTPPRVTTMEVEHFDDNIGSKLEIMESVAVENDEFCLVNRRKKRAAVLICLFEGNEGELRVILTKRSMKLSSHPGDVALPGGKMEEGDADDSATALREAMEEIGLDPHLVQVVANLEPFISQHQLKVVPVVGLLARVEDFKPVLNTNEVDTLFDVPLEMFLKAITGREAVGGVMKMVVLKEDGEGLCLLFSIHGSMKQGLPLVFLLLPSSYSLVLSCCRLLKPIKG